MPVNAYARRRKSTSEAMGFTYAMRSRGSTIAYSGRNLVFLVEWRKDRKTVKSAELGSWESWNIAGNAVHILPNLVALVENS